MLKQSSLVKSDSLRISAGKLSYAARISLILTYFCIKSSGRFLGHFSQASRQINYPIGLLLKLSILKRGNDFNLGKTAFVAIKL